MTLHEPIITYTYSIEKYMTCHTGSGAVDDLCLWLGLSVLMLRWNTANLIWPQIDVNSPK